MALVALRLVLLVQLVSLQLGRRTVGDADLLYERFAFTWFGAWASGAFAVLFPQLDRDLGVLVMPVDIFFILPTTAGDWLLVSS